MDFLAYREHGCYILNLNDEELSEAKVTGLREFVARKKNSARFGLDLKEVKAISLELAEFLKESKTPLSVFGLSTELLGYISLVNLAKYVSVYQNKDDFLNDKRRFAKRVFTVVK